MTRILIVDDERSIRITLQEFLKDAGYEVDVAEDAEKAMAKLAAANFDVTLADIVMPRITGVGLLKVIKENAPHVQVILMTGEPAVETAAEAVRAGAFDYLTKPINKAQLIKTVTNAVERKNLYAERRHLEAENRKYQENLEYLIQERTAALRESKERFDLAINATKDGLFDWDLLTNDIYYSPSWKRMLGYTDGELPNDFSVWEKLTEPEDVKRSWKMQKELINKERDRFELEFKMKHKDGHWVEILSRAEAVFDASGKAVRIVGTHVDISESKRAEQELRQYTQRLETLNEITAVLSATLSLDDVLMRILEKLALVLSFDSASVFLQEENQLRIVIHQGFIPEEEIVNKAFPKNNELFPRKPSSKQPVYLADAQADPRFDTWVGTEYIRGWMGIPLFVRDELIGYLSLDSYQVGAYGADEAAIVTPFANQAAQAIENARLHEQIQHHVDQLEERVEERTAELTMLIKAMTGREVRMAELKKVIKKLRTQLEEAGIQPSADDPLIPS